MLVLLLNLSNKVVSNKVKLISFYLLALLVKTLALNATLVQTFSEEFRLFIGFSKVFQIGFSKINISVLDIKLFLHV